jgi:hypothetical protein
MTQVSQVTAHLCQVILTYKSRRSKTRKAHFLTCGIEIMPKLNMKWRINEPSSLRKESAGKDMLPYPHVSVNCTVELERVETTMLEGMLPQSQKKEVSTTTPKKKRNKITEKINYVYRKDMTKGFLLLRKCVPGIKKLPGKKKGFLAQTY